MYVSFDLHSIPVFQKETESQERPSDLVNITHLVSAKAGCKARFFESCIDYLLSDCPWQHSLAGVLERRQSPAAKCSRGDRYTAHETRIQRDGQKLTAGKLCSGQEGEKRRTERAGF